MTKASPGLLLAHCLIPTKISVARTLRTCNCGYNLSRAGTCHFRNQELTCPQQTQLLLSFEMEKGGVATVISKGVGSMFERVSSFSLTNHSKKDFVL